MADSLAWKDKAGGKCVAEVGTAVFCVVLTPEGWECSAKAPGAKAEVIGSGLPSQKAAKRVANRAVAAKKPPAAKATAKKTTKKAAKKPAKKVATRAKEEPAPPPKVEVPGVQAAPASPSLPVELVTDGCLCGREDGVRWVADQKGNIEWLAKVRPETEEKVRAAVAARFAAAKPPQPEAVTPMMCERCGHIANQAERHNAVGGVECPAGMTEFRPATPAEVRKYGRRDPGPPRPGTGRHKDQLKADAKRAKAEARQAKADAKRAKADTKRAAAESKRGPGRPRKDAADEPKRGPGRPRKDAADEPKRGPGRPRKDAPVGKPAAKNNTKKAASKTAAKKPASPATETPRPRGRPPGSKNKPAEGSGETPAKRGRPPGSKNKPKDAPKDDAPKDPPPAKRGRPPGSKNQPKADKPDAPAAKSESGLKWLDIEGRRQAAAGEGNWQILAEGSQDALYYYDAAGTGRFISAGSRDKLEQIAAERHARGGMGSAPSVSPSLEALFDSELRGGAS